MGTRDLAPVLSERLKHVIKLLLKKQLASYNDLGVTCTAVGGCVSLRATRQGRMLSCVCTISMWKPLWHHDSGQRQRARRTKRERTNAHAHRNTQDIESAVQPARVQQPDLYVTLAPAHPTGNRWRQGVLERQPLTRQQLTHWGCRRACFCAGGPRQAAGHADGRQRPCQRHERLGRALYPPPPFSKAGRQSYKAVPLGGRMYRPAAIAVLTPRAAAAAGAATGQSRM